jgi:uncharacterized protein YcbX
MISSLAQIWRHPIKAHGFEALERVKVTADQTLPWDRTWAVTHEASKAKEDGSWAPCANFSRGAKAPSLMAISASLEEETEVLVLSHPKLPDIAFRPDDPSDAARFIGWVAPLMPADRAASTGLVRAEGQGMTDADRPWISIGNLASLQELSNRMGRDLDPRRFRINLWIDGVAPWEEFDWIGRGGEIGDVSFKVEERITRCKATMASPETGHRDADTLSALEAGWGHQDFGVYAQARSTGVVQIGDQVRI